MIVRPADATDIDVVLALWAAEADQPTHTDNAAGVGALVAHDPGALLLAWDGDALVGSVIAAWDGWRGSIYRLVVASAHRRRGLGRQLLDAAHARLEGLGAVRLQATVAATDEPAVAFWAASGWELNPDRLRYTRG